MLALLPDRETALQCSESSRPHFILLKPLTSSAVVTGRAFMEFFSYLVGSKLSESLWIICIRDWQNEMWAKQSQRSPTSAPSNSSNTSLGSGTHV